MQKIEFDCLEEHEKTDLLRIDGVYIGKLVSQEVTSMLYQLYTFYVEIYYQSYRQTISRIETTNSPGIIDKYPPENGKESMIEN